MISKIYLIIYILGVSLVQASNDIGISNLYSLYFGKFLVAISFLFITIFLLKNNPKTILTIFIIIAFSKFYSLIGDQLALPNQLYLICIAVLFYMMGMHSYIIGKYNPIKQIFWFSIASIPILILQNINWPDFISYYNTQKFIDGEDNSSYFWPLFTSFDQIPEGGGSITAQAKPSGLTWSNAFAAFLFNLSLYLVLFISPFKRNFIYYFFILFGCIFCGAKVSIFGSFLLIMIYTYMNYKNLRKLNYIILYIFLIIGYFLIFPVFFEYNISIAALGMSFLSRYYDALGWFGLLDSDEALEVLSREYSIHNYSIEQFGSLSAFNFVFIGFFSFLVFKLLIYLFNKKFYYILLRALRRDYVIGYLFLVGISLSSTALQFNTILWFFSGYIFQKLKNDKLVIK